MVTEEHARNRRVDHCTFGNIKQEAVQVIGQLIDFPFKQFDKGNPTSIWRPHSHLGKQLLGVGVPKTTRASTLDTSST